jgi:hypothetical protein
MTVIQKMVIVNPQSNDFDCKPSGSEFLEPNAVLSVVPAEGGKQLWLCICMHSGDFAKTGARVLDPFSKTIFEPSGSYVYDLQRSRRMISARQDPGHKIGSPRRSRKITNAATELNYGLCTSNPSKIDLHDIIGRNSRCTVLFLIRPSGNSTSCTKRT